MTAAAERRHQDCARLQAMCAASDGRLRLIARSGDPPADLTIELACRSALSEEYPGRWVDRVRARIQLPARYPFQPPLVMLDPPIFHPNVYASGQVCLGAKWIPTEGLDLLVRRVAQIVTFDASVLNVHSPANSTAAQWYRTAMVRSPSAFPTDRLGFLLQPETRPAVQWRELAVEASAGAQLTVQCGSCRRTLRVPHSAGAQARCPACHHIFRIQP